MSKRNLAILGLGLLPFAAMAEEVAAAATTGGSALGYAYLGAGLCMGLASAVVGLGQSRAAAAALEGMGRNPGAAKAVFVPLILSLALMESLVLFAFVIANTLAGK